MCDHFGTLCIKGLRIRPDFFEFLLNVPKNVTKGRRVASQSYMMGKSFNGKQPSLSLKLCEKYLHLYFRVISGLPRYVSFNVSTEYCISDIYVSFNLIGFSDTGKPTRLREIFTLILANVPIFITLEKTGKPKVF